MTVDEYEAKIKELEEQLNSLREQCNLAYAKELVEDGDKFLDDYEHKYYYQTITYDHSKITNVMHIQGVTERPSGVKELNVIIFEHVEAQWDDVAFTDYHFVQCARDLMYGELRDQYKSDEYLTPSEFYNWKTQAEISVITKQSIMSIDEIKNGVNV